MILGVEVLHFNGFGSAEVHNFGIQVTRYHHVLELDVAVDETLGMNVRQPLQDLRQVKSGYLLLLLHQLHVLVDLLQHRKQVAKGAVLQHLADVLFGFDCLIVTDHARVLHSTQHEPLNHGFV